MSESAPPAPPVPEAAVPSRPWTRPLVLFGVLLAAYLSTGGFLPAGDTIPNVYLPVNLLTRGTFSFSPADAPFMFLWELRRPEGASRVDVESWSSPIAGRKASELRDEGVLVLVRPRYYLVESSRKGEYVNTYGPGAGLVATPYFAALALVRKDWKSDMAVLSREGRIFAAICVAGSAVFVYFALLAVLRREAALGLGLLYGLGTCVWAEPTMALWQQSPALLFVAAGAYFLTRVSGDRKSASLCGFAFGLAALCRPTAGILLLAAGAYLLLKERKLVAAYVGGAAPPLLILAGYNAWYLGSPFRFGQVQAAEAVSASIGDPSSAWSNTSVILNFAGVLVSPSRGLFVFTPIFLFSAWGAVEAWRSPRFPAARVFGAAVAGFVLLAAAWFQWFGGSCFGYRVIVESSPLLMLLLAPVADRILACKGWRTAFALCAVWSLAVQTLGALAYDPLSWNSRVGYELQMRDRPEPYLSFSEDEVQKLGKSGEAVSGRKIRMDVGNPRYRGRLWSVSDSQLVYFFGRNAFAESRAVRESLIRRVSRDVPGN